MNTVDLAASAALCIAPSCTAALPFEKSIEQNSLFEEIAQDLADTGMSIKKHALPKELADILHFHMVNMPSYKFNEASIGRLNQQRLNEKVRNDEIVWIYGDSPAGKAWIEWTQALQQYLNRHLFMGLFSFESHFAHYAKGNYYKRHLDAFKGQANRRLSLVTYLNPEWHAGDGGELVMYKQAGDKEGINILPDYGTIALFLSEDFEHEVKPAMRDRYSIAGWFSVNRSTAERVDPPL